MKFGSCEVGCWGGDWSVKGEFSPTTASCTICVSFLWGQMLQTIRLYATFETWGTLCLWMEKQVLVPWMYRSLLKRCPISLGMPLLNFSFWGTFIRCRYYWDFIVWGQMTVFALPGCKVRLSVAWLITALSSPSGRTKGAGLLGAEVEVLIFST